MMCPWNIFRGYVFYQFLLYVIRGVCRLGNQSEAVTDPEDMGVDSHRGLAKGNTLDDVGSLATNARQVEQLTHVRGYLAMMTLHQHTGHLRQMSGFGVRIRNATYIFEDLVGISLCHRMGIGEATEKLGGYLVDALVGTLRTEDNGYQQLKDTAGIPTRSVPRAFPDENSPEYRRSVPFYS